MYKKIFRICKSLLKKNQPIYAHYGVTHKCNLNCRICSIKNETPLYELTLTEIRKLAQKLYELGIIYISIGGGEPTTRKDILDIVNIFIRRNFYVRLLTNAVDINITFIKKLLILRVHGVSISLDSLSTRKQAYIWDCNEDLYNRTIKNIENFAKFSNKKKLFILNTVVSKLNIGELPDLVHFASKLGFYVSFIPLEINGSNNKFLKFTDSDYLLVNKIYNKLMDMKRQSYPIFNSLKFLQDSKDFIIKGENNWQCKAGKLYFSISPNGYISICHNKSLGFYYDIPEIVSKLKNSEFIKKVEYVTSKCQGCIRPCWAEVSNIATDKKTFFENTKLLLRNSIL